MGRKPHFTSDQFADAALELISEGGPKAVTIAAIAARIGAPVGSVYHRFQSRERILAEAWLHLAESFQEGFISLLEKDDAMEAALYTPRWVRSHPKEARVLLLHRREELVAGPWPQEIRRRAESLEKEIRSALAAFSCRFFGSSEKQLVRRCVFALIDVPLAAVRRPLEEGRLPSPAVQSLIRESCESIMRRKP
ncbi:MAG: TetR/AcrR family transcriptional regulator [Deltaproteobacteria bacterium HGW-Deltaproteobacteria-19]|jgi:AcrR family transcriptional regulator|nr:MAG: TetR/AcrR family transcriptional regulator [Deltaproteobacteria bacterium HGW-Deltaproteobacteria-19]